MGFLISEPKIRNFLFYARDRIKIIDPKLSGTGNCYEPWQPGLDSIISKTDIQFNLASASNLRQRIAKANTH